MHMPATGERPTSERRQASSAKCQNLVVLGLPFGSMRRKQECPLGAQLPISADVIGRVTALDALMSEEGPEPDIEPARLNVREVP